MRYYFDLKYGATVASDEEGLDLPNLAAAQGAAARALADTVLQAMYETELSTKKMVIEVRDERGPILQCLFAFQRDKHS